MSASLKQAERRAWTRFMCAAFTAIGVDASVSEVARIADAMLDEWRKRFVAEEPEPLTPSQWRALRVLHDTKGQQADMNEMPALVERGFVDPTTITVTVAGVAHLQAESGK